MLRLLEDWIRTASDLAIEVAGLPLGDPPPLNTSVVENYDFAGLPLPLSPPDGSTLGVHNTRTLTSQISVITDVNVWFHLDNPAAGGAFNGDFYATLTHDSGFSVLLNRVGRRGGEDADPFGYPDNGFQVTLDDQAPSGDIHLYRLQLPASEGGPAALSHSTEVDPSYQAALTGTWAPDGRAVHPADAIAEAARTRLLNQFNGLPASGQWTLFVADLSPGGNASLRGWGLQLTGLTAIPEPAGLALAGTLLLALGAAVAKRRTR